MRIFLLGRLRELDPRVFEHRVHIARSQVAVRDGADAFHRDPIAEQMEQVVAIGARSRRAPRCGVEHHIERAVPLQAQHTGTAVLALALGQPGERAACERRGPAIVPRHLDRPFRDLEPFQHLLGESPEPLGRHDDERTPTPAPGARREVRDSMQRDRRFSGAGLAEDQLRPSLRSPDCAPLRGVERHLDWRRRPRAPIGSPQRHPPAVDRDESLGLAAPELDQAPLEHNAFRDPVPDRDLVGFALGCAEERGGERRLAPVQDGHLGAQQRLRAEQVVALSIADPHAQMCEARVGVAGHRPARRRNERSDARRRVRARLGSHAAQPKAPPGEDQS